MAVIGTYNGASILAFPTCPAIRQLQIEMNDTVAMSQSPFTGGGTQVQAWPGSDFWSAQITLPQMTIANAAVWTAFLAECRGITNVFPLGHPQYRRPQGKLQGSVPVVNGVNAPMATTLNVRGLKPNAQRVLLPGDRFQIGATPDNATAAGLCRYHMVLDPVSADGNGDATIQIWPSLREATTDGETIVLNNPQGLFRLAKNKRSVLSAETRLAGISLEVVEAR